MRISDIFRKKSKDAFLDAIAQSMDKDIERMKNGMSADLSSLSSIPTFDEDKVLESVFDNIGKRRAQRRRTLYRTAAAALLLIVGGVFGYIAWHQGAVEYDEIYARRGEKLIVILADGSRVNLNSDSRLRYPRKFTGSERRVTLEGEGFFEVSKDKSHPFYVDCYDMEVKVTGTRFNVNAYPDNSQIVTTLYDGHVSVGCKTTPEDSRNALLPGEEAIYARSTHDLKVQKTDNISLDDLWTKQVINVQDIRLEQLLRILERQYGVTFHIKNNAIRKYTYNITCDAANLQDVFDVMQTITPVRIKKVANRKYEIR